MRNGYVPTPKLDGILRGRVIHRHHRDYVIILVKHLNPGTVDSGPWLVQILALQSAGTSSAIVSCPKLRV